MTVMCGTVGTAELTLPTQREGGVGDRAPHRVRAWIRQVLGPLNEAGRLDEAISKLLSIGSELVLNAVRHSRSGEVNGRVTVRLRIEGEPDAERVIRPTAIHIEVVDGGSLASTPRVRFDLFKDGLGGTEFLGDDSGEDPDGLLACEVSFNGGLFIVWMLADGYGCEVPEDRSSCTTWAMVCVP